MKTILKGGVLGALLAGGLACAQAQELAPDVLVKNVTTEVLELITKDKEIRSIRDRIEISRRIRAQATEAQASARDVTRIIAQIRAEKIPAVFLENVTDPRLLERIARESGARIGGTLYSDALTEPNGQAPTYINMMRHNVRELVAALR